jgi:hypothetical protein
VQRADDGEQQIAEGSQERAEAGRPERAPREAGSRGKVIKRTGQMGGEDSRQKRAGSRLQATDIGHKMWHENRSSSRAQAGCYVAKHVELSE